jgi:hypothetical protein
VFESLYETCERNLARTVEALRQAVASKSEPFQALRAWLNERGAERFAAEH